MSGRPIVAVRLAGEVAPGLRKAEEGFPQEGRRRRQGLSLGRFGLLQVFRRIFQVALPGAVGAVRFSRREGYGL